MCEHCGVDTKREGQQGPLGQYRARMVHTRRVHGTRDESKAANRHRAELPQPTPVRETSANFVRCRSFTVASPFPLHVEKWLRVGVWARQAPVGTLERGKHTPFHWYRLCRGVEHGAPHSEPSDPRPALEVLTKCQGGHRSLLFSLFA